MLEDDDRVAEIIEQFLCSQDFRVTRVASGAAGLRVLLSKDFDLILWDMIMPVFSGEMFYLAVQRIRPHLCKRFLFTTRHRANPKIEAFIRRVQGMMLRSPFEAHELREAIDALFMRCASEQEPVANS